MTHFQPLFPKQTSYTLGPEGRVYAGRESNRATILMWAVLAISFLFIWLPVCFTFTFTWAKKKEVIKMNYFEVAERGKKETREALKS